MSADDECKLAFHSISSPILISLQGKIGISVSPYIIRQTSRHTHNTQSGDEAKINSSSLVIGEQYITRGCLGFQIVRIDYVFRFQITRCLWLNVLLQAKLKLHPLPLALGSATVTATLSSTPSCFCISIISIHFFPHYQFSNKSSSCSSGAALTGNCSVISLQKSARAG